MQRCYQRLYILIDKKFESQYDKYHNHIGEKVCWFQT